jgi:hypothetical protein
MNYTFLQMTQLHKESLVEYRLLSATTYCQEALYRQHQECQSQQLLIMRLEVYQNDPSHPSTLEPTYMVMKNVNPFSFSFQKENSIHSFSKEVNCYFQYLKKIEFEVSKPMLLEIATFV